MMWGMDTYLCLWGRDMVACKFLEKIRDGTLENSGHNPKSQQNKCKGNG